MRRPLTLAAFALMLFGLEVATGAVSVAAVRLLGGLTAVLGGDEFIVSGPRYVTGIGLAFAGTALYGAMLWADQARGEILSGGALCPNCGTDTKRVRRLRRHRILSQVLGTDVTRHRCARCGWNGLST